MSLGPLWVDIAGPQLTAKEINYLKHPLVGGVILFTRNYQNREQLTQLCAAIQALRKPELIIAVDHEGGRVQRFQTEFTRLPPLAELGEAHEQNPTEALAKAEQLGFTMASELKNCGVDLSLAPVLDLNKGISKVLAGGRAISANSAVVITVAKAYIRGMHRASMAATGKHFPGHGSVEIDSHLGITHDARPLAELIADDLKPFVALFAELQAIMPAHIIFSSIDDKPASLSKIWLQNILRDQLGFQGVVISDCLSMAGAAEIVPDPVERVRLALTAGCDIALICNNQAATQQILRELKYPISAAQANKIASLRNYER